MKGKDVCLHGKTEYIRENEIEVIERCLLCKEYIRYPKELKEVV